MSHITFVKKRKADGKFCRKCEEVNTRLRQAGLLERIDRVVVADETDIHSEGMQLAAKHHVEQAPFFIVRDDAGQESIYTVYLRFVKEVLQNTVSTREENLAVAEAVDFL